MFPSSCCLRRSTSESIGSSPAFSANVRGIMSSASAKASTASCSRPPTESANSRKCNESSVSDAPPPGRTLPSSSVVSTTPSESLIARSSSSTTCSVPPRRISVTDLASSTSSTKSRSSPPTSFCATDPANPRSSAPISSIVPTTFPPVARARLVRSDDLARRTARIPSSAR